MMRVLKSIGCFVLFSIISFSVVSLFLALITNGFNDTGILCLNMISITGYLLSIASGVVFTNLFLKKEG